MPPDTFGMTRVDEGVLEERLEKIEPPKPKNNQNDTLWIKNIDENCTDESFEPIRISERWRDPETGRVVTQFKDITYEFDHSKEFACRWSGQKFSIEPGKTARMPRFIGEHFATQLADHILDKMGVEKNRMLRNDPRERPKILAQIIVKEEPYFATGPETVGGEAMKQFEELNQAKPDIQGVEGEQYDNKGQKGIALGEADATPKDSVITPVGIINKESVEPTPDVILRLGQQSETDNLNVPKDWEGYSKAEIIEQIRHMAPDYKFGKNYTKAQLVGIIQRF